MTELNYRNWERREVYEFFSGISDPFYSISFRQDITELFLYTKKHKISFYKGMIWACTQALNGIEAFRVSMRGGKLLLLDKRNPSFTDINPGKEQFHIVTVEHLPDIDAFCREADRISRTQNSFIDFSKETDKLIYYSCIPWVDLTSMTNEKDLLKPGALDDSIPRIAWGKIIDRNGRKILGLSVEVNHRFIDGIHVGMFAKKLGELIREIETETDSADE